jgi:hypothetical protein
VRRAQHVPMRTYFDHEKLKVARIREEPGAYLDFLEQEKEHEQEFI